MLPWAWEVFTLTLLGHCRKAGHAGSPLHHFFSVCSCLSSLFNFWTWAWCCLYRIQYEDFVIFFLILSSLLHLSLTLRRPILHRGPWVGPVSWPWRAGSSPAMPPRTQRDGGPSNRRTQSLDLAHHCLFAAKDQI